MALRDEAARYLAMGIPTGQVADALGVTPSDISQLLAEEKFQDQVAKEKEKIELDAKDAKFDEALDSTEEKLIEMIEKKLPYANLAQLTQTFKAVNGARRRKDGIVGVGTGVPGLTVTLSLPAAAVPQYLMNAKSEIVEVEGKTMLTARPNQLNEILKARNSGALESKMLPGITRVERAVDTLELVTPKMVRKITPKMLPEELKDLL